MILFELLPLKVEMLYDGRIYGFLVQGLALAMYQNDEAPAAFEMLNQALKIADSEDQVTAKRNIKLLIAELHVLKVCFAYLILCTG